MVFLGGPPWWEAMFGGEGRDARPNAEEEMYVGRDRAQNDVVLRNVGGGEEGSGSVANYCDRFFFFLFLFSSFFFKS